MVWRTTDRALFGLAREGENLRVFLRLQNQFCGQQRLLLILRGMGSVYDVGDKLRSERQFHLVAIDVSGLLPIHNE